MADKNFFEQFDTPAAPNGVIITKPNTPKSAAETAIAQAKARYAGQSEAADLIAKNDAHQNAPMVTRKLVADTSRSESAAVLEAMKADEAKANAAIATMSANSDVHGDAYLQKYVPAAMRNTVKAYARGDLGSRSGGMSTSMLPIIQHALNYDPTASGINFPTRVKMQSELASNNPNSVGGSLRSIEQMLLHGRDALHASQALGNYGSGFGSSIQNTTRNAYHRFNEDPRFGAFDEKARNYTQEAQKAFSGVAGGAHERQDRLGALSSSSSPDYNAATLQSDAKMIFGRMASINDQYHRVMGRDITDALSPEAKRAYDEIMAGGYDAKGKPMRPVQGFVPISPDAAGPPPPTGNGTEQHRSTGFDPTGGGGASVATGGSKTVYDAGNSAMIDRLIRAGATPEQINAALTPGSTPVDPAKVLNWQRYLKQHPDYKGSTGESTHEEPTTLLNQIAGSAPSAAVMGAVNGATAGFSDEIGAGIGALAGGNYSEIRDDLDARKKALATAHPFADIIGNVTGGIGALALPSAALARAGAGAAGILAPGAVALDAGYGALYGAGENNNDRLGGAAFGGVTGALGGVAGRSVGVGAGLFGRSRAGQAIGQKFGDLTGRGYTPPPSALTGAESAAYGAADKAGIPGIQAQLAEAQRLGVPMSLADTTPELTSLAGAAVRRSPTAAQLAQNAYNPRALGQVDRFGQAINRDLGPTANVPQLSQDLMTQAKTAAGPLYDKAYAQPVISTPELDSLLNTPFGREGLGKARTIIANERGSPTELGISQDASGNPVMNPQPGAAISRSLAARSELDAAQAAYRADRSPASIARIERAREEMRQAQLGVSMSPDPNAVASVPGYHTKALDYVKRGMDDVLEQSRDQFGRLNLTGALKAQNDVKTSLLSEMDRLNPHYRDARAAFAGPMQSRDALALGADATKMDPQELALGLMGKSPEQLGQVQLGYRSGLTGQADAMRYNRNPFDTILGTPDAEARLATVYPGNPGNANLLRQRDLEAQLARTNTAITGGSQTAGRSVADRAFDLAAAPSLALDAGMITMGHAPLATAALLGAKGLKTAAQRYGQRLSVSKADDLAPLLLNTDPAASGMTLSSIAARQQAYFDAVQAQRRRVQQPAGMFGAAFGAQGAR